MADEQSESSLFKIWIEFYEMMRETFKVDYSLFKWPNCKNTIIMKLKKFWRLEGDILMVSIKLIRDIKSK